MQVIAIIPKNEKDPKQYLVKATEAELDLISGIAESLHIEGRIQIGNVIKVSELFDKVNTFAENEKDLKSAARALRSTADSIDNLLPDKI